MIITTDKPMRKRDPNDFYPTPLAVCRAGIALLAEQYPAFKDIVDPGAGSGVWGIAARELWPNAVITGFESRLDAPRPAAYTNWVADNFLAASAEVWNSFDAAIGNPPYKIAQQFIEHTMSMLKSGSPCLQLLRLNFLEGQGRARGFFKRCKPRKVYVLAGRPSFIESGEKKGKTDATAYALILFEKDYDGSTTLEWLDWKRVDSGQLSLFEAK